MMQRTNYCSEQYYIGFGTIVNIVIDQNHEILLLSRKVWEMRPTLDRFNDEIELYERLELIRQNRRY